MYEKAAKDAPFIAYIPEFDVSSCGKTEAKARKNVKEALEIVLEEVKKKGEIDSFLQEAGVSPDKNTAFPKIIFEPFSVNL